ncbi:hypothetical protein Gorai_022523 [Gossypium raimondii]|uniref:Uncharacterized protein n=1 Tax=Gossypium raimondii TaxID=29730 RepID=A0A7J8NTH5_GOSRA|nr:hypothetical protein [Gossypium raimondii]
MATAIANPPVEIGTRGTVGSLVMQEIEYFSQLELRSKDSSKKPHSNVGPVVPTQKKKKRGSSKLIPSICSMVEISDNRSLGISGLSYRNLKSDVNKLQEFYLKLYSQNQALESGGCFWTSFLSSGKFGGVCNLCAGLTESSSRVIRELIVPLVPTLIDPPPPLIASSFCTMFPLYF